MTIKENIRYFLKTYSNRIFSLIINCSKCNFFFMFNEFRREVWIHHGTDKHRCELAHVFRKAMHHETVGIFARKT